MIKWNEYTWYSKSLAVIFFLVVLPSWTFYIGTKYQEVINIKAGAYSQIQMNTERAGVTTPEKLDEVMDCEGVSTSDMAQCGYRDLKIQEGLLNSEYKKLVNFFDENIKEDDVDSPAYQTMKESLVASHVAWTKYADEFCTVQTGFGAADKNGAPISGTIARIEYPMCKTDLTKIYIKNIQAISSSLVTEKGY